MEYGKNGEIIIESRLENWYVKVGARLTKNQVLLSHVKETPLTEDVGRVLGQEHAPSVIKGLTAIAGLNHFSSLPYFVYPVQSEIYLAELENSANLKTPRKKK